MQSRWSDADAARAIDTWGKKFGETLALRTYTARLLGAESALVLHGGGNTSAKGRAKTILGEDLDVLFIKGSGWDLATIEPPGHPAVRLDPLRKLRALDDLSDEAMVNEQRIALLDASAPNPSIECLLHAFLPFPFVDHTHADAVLAIADQPNALEICREVYGDGLVFVPYVKPGFLLAQACAKAFEQNRERADVIVLQQHGIFTFGPDARTSYERMIDAVTRAERHVSERRPRVATSSASISRDSNALRRRVAPILRGVLERAGGPSVLDWDESPSARAFVDDESSSKLSQIGPATPDHVIRTKPWPMVVPHLDPHAPDAAIRAAMEHACARFSETYKNYVNEGVAARGPRKQLDSAPRVTLVPGVGVVGAGKTKKDASIAREIYGHTIDVVRAATSIGSYRPVAPLDLFDLEYWPLEQAKLGREQKKPLDGKIALVTGGASGIGRATVVALLGVGAHVVVADRDEESLDETRIDLSKSAGARVRTVRCDVADEASVQSAVDACIDAFGGLDVVVSNAGTAPQGLLHDDDGAHALEASMQINFESHQLVARAASRVMLAQATGGSLLFNASKAAFNPGPSFGPYAVAKAATVALMRQYAIDLGAHGVRSNAVNADRIRTRLFGDGVLEARAKARGLEPDAYFRANLLSREVAAEDVANAFVWLATAPSTTGCVITVDGGNAAAFPR
jgi:rhamnose utilization protein RhaD (predicted bifunctional aldolase and dehydrogenase)/NAD(P)-dependent dehydrogenase (short-subunit alcohol dehydrogenase family)